MPPPVSSESSRTPPRTFEVIVVLPKIIDSLDETETLFDPGEKDLLDFAHLLTVSLLTRKLILRIIHPILLTSLQEVPTDAAFEAVTEITIGHVRNGILLALMSRNLILHRFLGRSFLLRTHLHPPHMRQHGSGRSPR